MADTDVCGLQRELAKAEAREEALLTRVCLLESAYLELEKELTRTEQASGCMRPRPTSSRRRLAQPATRFSRPPGPADEGSDAVELVLVARRLAREGRAREDFESFLEESFRLVDTAALLERLLAGPAEPETPTAE
jgi:hypothetical protein